MAIRTVLIAEDEEEIRRLLGRMLSGPELRVLTVGNGAEALEAARRQRPDLVILDYFMPQLDGFETCRALRADARTRDIAFAGKPIDWAELLGWIHVLLRGRPEKAAQARA